MPSFIGFPLFNQTNRIHTLVSEHPLFEFLSVIGQGRVSQIHPLDGEQLQRTVQSTPQLVKHKIDFCSATIGFWDKRRGLSFPVSDGSETTLRGGASPRLNKMLFLL